MYCILIYDISDDKNGAKVMRCVFKICKSYMMHIQKSIFEGELSNSQYIELKNKLKVFLRDDLDSCIIFSSENPQWLKKDFLTKPNDDTSNFI